MKLLIWDFDGTLGHCEGLWSGVFAHLLAIEAPEMAVQHADIVLQLQTGFPWHAPENPHTHLTTPDAWWDAMLPTFERAFLALGLNEALSTRLATMVRARYCDPKRWHLFPDTLEALDQLSAADWRHVLLSNHVPELSEILTALGIHGRFERIVNSAISGYEKPHPQAFSKSIEGLGEPVELWMAGDSFSADYLGATALGWNAALVRREHPDALHCFASLTGFSDFLIAGSPTGIAI